MADGVEGLIRLLWVIARVFLLIISLFVLPFVLAARRQRVESRRNEMTLLADKLSLQIAHGPDSELASNYQFLDRLGAVDCRALNIIEGEHKDRSVKVFDCTYRSGNIDWYWAPSWNRPVYLGFIVIELERSFPELIISREGLLSKIVQTIGFDDIDFDSHEFSQQFLVRSNDKKFAYDFCNAQMIEYLLERPDTEIEVEQQALALAHDGLPSATTLEKQLDHLLKIRSLMPNYLFAS